MSFVRKQNNKQLEPKIWTGKIKWLKLAYCL